MCSAWWQNLACDSYQECGWVEPIPSSGSGHWPVSRPSSVPVGNDILYRCCGGRRFRRDDGGQSRSDTYLEWRRRGRPILKAMEREVRIWADTVAGETALKIYGSSDEIGSQDLPRCVRHFGPNVVIVMWTVHWILCCKSNKYWRNVVEIVFCASILVPDYGLNANYRRILANVVSLLLTVSGLIMLFRPPQTRSLWICSLEVFVFYRFTLIKKK